MMTVGLERWRKEHFLLLQEDRALRNHSQALMSAYYYSPRDSAPSSGHYRNCMHSAPIQPSRHILSKNIHTFFKKVFKK